MAHNVALTVVLGAGTSYDCVDARNNGDQRYRPPLVEQLFDPRESSFDNILNKYPKARALSSFIRSEMQKGASLEEVLRGLESHPNVNVRKQYWQVPLYLQELLGEVSSHYVRAGGTKFDELIFRIERSSYSHVFYVSLNYDLFLEKALENMHGIKFIRLNDYLHAKWSFIKLHGSVNWWRAVITNDKSQEDIFECLDSLNTLTLHDEIRVTSSYQERRRLEGYLYYPALAAPVAEKSLFQCHPSLVEQTRSFITNCEDFLFLGFSGRDRHVLDLLRETPKVRKFAIVNGGEEAGVHALHAIRNVNKRFDPHVAFPGHPQILRMGFNEFVASELDAFLASPGASEPELGVSA